MLQRPYSDLHVSARLPVPLSVVIPALDEAASIGACVESAQGLGGGWRDAVEVIVADGGSGDGTPELAEAAGARVISCRRGRGRQLRAGADRATGEVLLMLHADCTIAADAGRQLREVLDNPAVVCGAFRQQIESSGALYRLLERGNAFRARRLGLPYGDQAIFVRRAALEEVGGVPDLPLMEDVALMQRLRRRAWPVLLPGPVAVSARRWRRHGVVRQTARNWALSTAFTLGVPASRLARRYAPHGSEPPAEGSVTSG